MNYNRNELADYIKYLKQDKFFDKNFMTRIKNKVLNQDRQVIPIIN